MKEVTRPNTILFKTVSRPDIVLLFNSILPLPTKSLDEAFLWARGFVHPGGRSQLNMYMDDFESFTDLTMISYTNADGGVHEYLSIESIKIMPDEDEPLSTIINIKFMVPAFLNAENEVVPSAVHYSNGARIRYFCKNPLKNGETFYDNGKPVFTTDSNLHTDFDDFYIQRSSTGNTFMLSGAKDIASDDIHLIKKTVSKVVDILKTVIAHHVRKISIAPLYDKKKAISYTPDALVVQKISFQRGMAAFTLVLYFKEQQEDPKKKLFLAK